FAEAFPPGGAFLGDARTRGVRAGRPFVVAWMNLLPGGAWMNVRWSGFADLTFASSARLAFSRALEQAETDVNEHQAQAWVIEDRRISFSIDAEASRHALEGTRRLLGALVLLAAARGTAVEVTGPPSERGR